MNSKKLKSGLDIIKTPIIICKKDEKATVIYKNPNARERIKHPTVDNGIFKYIIPYHIPDYENILNGGKPKVISLNIKNITTNALAGNYIYNNEAVTIWIFLDMLRIKSYTSFFGYHINRDENLFGDFIKLIDSTIDAGNIADILDNNSRFYRTQNIFADIVNDLFDSMPMYRSEICNMPELLDVVIDMSKNIITKSGYRFHILKDKIKNDFIYMNDIGVFLSVFVHMIMFAINLSYNKEGFVEFSTYDSNLIIELNFTIINPPYLINNCTDAGKLIKTFPQECFNMMLFNQYINYKSWKFDFDITDTARNNFTLRIYVGLPDDNYSIFRTDSIKGTEFDRRITDIKEFITSLLNAHLGK